MTRIRTKNQLIKLLLILFGSAITFMFGAPLFGRIFNIANILGILAGCVILATGIFLDKVKSAVGIIRQNKKGRFAFNTITAIVLAGAICFFSALGSIIAYSGTSTNNQQVVIVLGCAVYNKTPSTMLRARVNSAYEYLTEHKDSVAILSGGQGNGEAISEAECMRQLLVKKGIDESRLYIEDKSTNTAENIANSKEILKENGLGYDVIIATSDFHLKRATMIAEKQGLNSGRLSASSGLFATPTFYFRDTIGVIAEFLFG